MFREELVLRAAAENEATDVGEDLALVTARLDKVEEREEEHLATISQLKNKLKEQEAMNKNLQSQLDEHQDQQTFLSNLEIISEQKTFSLRTLLEDNTEHRQLDACRSVLP